MSRIHLAIISGILVVAGLSADSSAQSNWPHLRGPGYDAISTETGLAESWPDGGPPVLWSIELGQGYSGFVVGCGRLFTQFQSKTSQYVLALDPDSGAELWRTRVGASWQPLGAYPGPYATPTWYADRVYFTTPMGRVGCLDAADGRVIWSVSLRERFGLNGVDFGYAATPFVEEGRVILPVGGPGASVVALRADDGSTAWAVGDDPASYCPICPIVLGGRRLIVAYLQNALVLHDAATGERLWRQHLSNHYDEHSAWPLFSDPYLFVAAPFKQGAQSFRLDASEKGVSVKQLWQGKPLSNDVCSSILFDGHVYGFDLQQLQSSPHRASRGTYQCLELATGATKWETDRIGQATVLCADGKLILLDDTGTLILAKANPKAFVELARAKVLDDGLCWTPPALWNGRLFLRNQARAVCVFLGPESALDPNRPIARSAPARDRFDWSRLLPREPEFPHDQPTRSELARWFYWCLGGVFAPAVILAVVLAFGLQRLRANRPAFWACALFPTTSFLLGSVGTTIFSEWADTFVLTWPASLYVSFRTILALGVRAEKQPRTLRLRLRSGAALLVFLGICFGYYKLCAIIGYAVGWVFLIGFLPAMPIAALAAKQRRWWLRWMLDALGFAVYFWSSGFMPSVIGKG